MRIKAGVYFLGLVSLLTGNLVVAEPILPEA